LSVTSTRGPPTLLLEELAEQPFGGLLVSPALDENIENEAVLVDGTQEPMPLPGEADDHIIEVPFVATARRSPTYPVGEFPAEFEAPLPDRLGRHRDTRAASISSTMRRLNGNRKYSHTA
jgi:hypothetical protein